MSNTPISKLSKQSIEAAIKICDVVAVKNSRNEISVNMANGIKDYVTSKGFLKPLQAKWIIRNAAFWKLATTDELEQLAAKEQPQTTPSEPTTDLNVSQQIAASLARIEDILDTRLQT